MPDMCSAYDQISDRRCRYYTGHHGSHNFARADHDTTLERELRRALDAAHDDLAEALDLFDRSWCPEHGHAPSPEVFARADALRKQVPRLDCQHNWIRYVLDDSPASHAQKDGDDEHARPYRDIPMWPQAAFTYAKTIGSDFASRVIAMACRDCDAPLDADMARVSDPQFK